MAWPVVEDVDTEFNGNFQLVQGDRYTDTLSVSFLKKKVS